MPGPQDKNKKTDDLRDDAEIGGKLPGRTPQRSSISNKRESKIGERPTSKTRLPEGPWCGG
jgi:hypothetical protein